MPVYGLLTQKSSPLNPQFENRYWIQADTLEEAQIKASSVVDCENILFGSTVTTVNTHVWLPNQNPNKFSNSPRTDVGLVPAPAPLPSWIVVELVFGAEDSYLMYKQFRVQVAATAILDHRWNTEYTGIIEDAAEAFDGIKSMLRTQAGGVITSVSYNRNLQFNKESKGWYNRKPKPPT